VSDIPQAPDWWQASDGKWYPPQAGQEPADPFTQMQQGTPAAPSAPPFTNLGYGQTVNAGKGCMSLGMIITVVTLLIGGVITAVVLFAVKDASDTIDETFDTNDEAIESVRVTDCSKDESSPLGWGTATMDVTNDSDQRSTYIIEVTFESRNGERQFGTGHATASSVQPGRTTTVEADSLAEVPRQFTCTVTSVDRISA
jgi:hypothetical protein